MNEQIRSAFHRHLQSRGIPSEMFQLDATGAYEFATVEHEWSVWQAAIAAAPPVDAVPACKGSDSFCPCQDGDACHYAGKDAWPVDAVPGEPVAQDVALWQLVYGAMLGTDKTPKSVDDFEAAAKRVAEMIERRQLAASVASRAGSEPVGGPAPGYEEKRPTIQRSKCALFGGSCNCDPDTVYCPVHNGRAIIAPAAAAEPSDPLQELTDLSQEMGLYEVPEMNADRAAAEPSELTTCNCRWQGEKLVQQCTLHEAWRDAIRDWSERAKVAERQLPDRERAASLVAGEDTKLLDWLAENAAKLTPETTAEDDYVWVVSDFWMQPPREREMARDADLRTALAAARASAGEAQS